MKMNRRFGRSAAWLAENNIIVKRVIQRRMIPSNRYSLRTARIKDCHTRHTHTRHTYCQRRLPVRDDPPHKPRQKMLPCQIDRDGPDHYVRLNGSRGRAGPPPDQTGYRRNYQGRQGSDKDSLRAPSIKKPESFGMTSNSRFHRNPVIPLFSRIRDFFDRSRHSRVEFISVFLNTGVPLN